MPHRTRAQERIDSIDISPTKLLADIEELKKELEEARARADEYLAGLQRERAEFLNFKRRTEQDHGAAVSRAADGHHGPDGLDGPDGQHGPDGPERATRSSRTTSN